MLGIKFLRQDLQDIKKVKILFILSVYFVFLPFFHLFVYAGESYKTISPQEIMTLSKENPSEYVFLDVNEEGSASKIPNSIVIPLEKINSNCSDLDFSKTIIVYCQKGVRSLEASNKLSSLGAKNVINMEGGIEAWEKAGGKVEKKAVPLNKGGQGVVSTPMWPGGTCEIKLPE